MTDLTISGLRNQLGELLAAVRHNGVIIHVTKRGRRIAAVVPTRVAEAAERRNGPMTGKPRRGRATSANEVQNSLERATNVVKEAVLLRDDVDGGKVDPFRLGPLLRASAHLLQCHRAMRKVLRDQADSRVQSQSELEDSLPRMSYVARPKKAAAYQNAGAAGAGAREKLDASQKILARAVAEFDHGVEQHLEAQSTGVADFICWDDDYFERLVQVESNTGKRGTTPVCTGFGPQDNNDHEDGVATWPTR